MRSGRRESRFRFALLSGADTASTDALIGLRADNGSRSWITQPDLTQQVRGLPLGKQHSLFAEQAGLGIDGDLAPGSQRFGQRLEAAKEELGRGRSLRREVDQENGDPKQ